MKEKKLISMLFSLLFIGIVLFLSIKNVEADNIVSIENDFENIEKLLPEGAEIIYKDKERRVPLIVRKDIDNNNDEELFVVYKNKEINNVLFLAALKKVNEKWIIRSTIKGEGYELDVLDFSDIDGDGMEDVIFGLKISNEYGNIYSYKVLDTNLEKIFSTPYSKLEIIPQNNYGNRSKQTALAFWIKDTGEAYKISILRWSGKEFIEAKDLYKQYFKTVVTFYEDKVENMPNNAVYWYYLADAQYKCGLKKEALQSIGKGVSLDQEYPPKQKFEDLKRNIY